MEKVRRILFYCQPIIHHKKNITNKAIRETKHTASSRSDEHIRFLKDFFQKQMTYAYMLLFLYIGEKRWHDEFQLSSTI